MISDDTLFFERAIGDLRGRQSDSADCRAGGGLCWGRVAADSQEGEHPFNQHQACEHQQQAAD